MKYISVLIAVFLYTTPGYSEENLITPESAQKILDAIKFKPDLSESERYKFVDEELLNMNLSHLSRQNSNRAVDEVFARLRLTPEYAVRGLEYVTQYPYKNKNIVQYLAGLVLSACQTDSICERDIIYIMNGNSNLGMQIQGARNVVRKFKQHQQTGDDSPYHLVDGHRVHRSINNQVLWVLRYHQNEVQKAVLPLKEREKAGRVILEGQPAGT